MKVVVISASLALALSAAPVLAQTATRPAQPAPTQAKPATPAPAAPAPPATPPAPFPAGAKIAYVNLQQIANLSVEGKSLTAKVQALMQKKQNEAQTKSKSLADNQNKLQSGALSDAAKEALSKEIERQNVEGQRFQQDAQQEINELSQQLQNEFQQKLFPILDLVAKEKGIDILLSAADAGMVWAAPGLDITMDAVKKLDEKTAGKPAAAAPPAATPAPATKP
jgi:outer membrane protein